MSIVLTTREEIEKESLMKYDELCQYLQKKYGIVKGSYFVNSACKTVNHSIKRTNEGLFIHHIGEKESIELSNPKYALNAPFELQEGKNLVYCNYFEHMFLHVRIVKEFLKLNIVEETKMAVGIGGLVNFICPEIIDYINGYDYKREYMKVALSIIDGNEDLFLKYLFSLQKHINNVKYETILEKTFGYLTIDLFKGKMTKKGRFYDLTCQYSFENSVFKFNSLEEITAYIDELFLKYKPNYIYFGFYKEFCGDNCCGYVCRRTKSGGYASKDFRIYPRTQEVAINDYIKKLLQIV